MIIKLYDDFDLISLIYLLTRNDYIPMSLRQIINATTNRSNHLVLLFRNSITVKKGLLISTGYRHSGR